ncbi:MAG TPA: RdgB/HAM1 family non-canonical purine NTP pyrophosphatase [Burkholderiales bacterium]|nr:RdgB/HAM1 family non-canonical purine NTP pyrophosphatase [Burkholderiales bacterium]
MKKIVIASNNQGKLRELAALLASVEIEPLPQSAFNIPEPEEPHPTFIENAIAKARHASRLSGLPALADDSGICIDALNGEPGVHSARFAGEPKSDARNNEKLVSELSGKENRRAHYYCVIVMVRHADDPQPLIAEGAWYGEIIDTPRGSGGFGYDPYFYLPDLGRTSAELESWHKNAISHRGLAMKSLVARLREWW